MRRKSAYILFLAVLGLLVIGIVMLFSTSAYARDSHGDVYFFIKRQAIWVGIGLVACIFAALVNYHFWQKTWWLWFAVALAALALCYIPHIGMRINGSRRWVGYGPITFQPSELAKIARARKNRIISGGPLALRTFSKSPFALRAIRRSAVHAIPVTSRR